MTDTNTLAPTDAEILDAAEDFRSQYTHGGTTFDEFDEIGFARAALAKWGTPAPASQPAAAPSGPAREPLELAAIYKLIESVGGDMYDRASACSVIDFARAIEAAHDIADLQGEKT